MKKVLIISTSLRKNSNSKRLAEEFKKGVLEAGNNAEIISLEDKTINFCRGCLACQKLKKCIIDDDVNNIVEKIKNSDVIVWATPIYYYEMSGLMKTLIDRANALYVSNYNFKDVYLLATCADTGENSMDGALKGLQGWIDCLSGTQIKGIVKGLGVNDPGEIENNKIALKQAYEMGKAV